MVYIYLAKEPDNQVFRRRGAVERYEDAVGFASQMVKHGLEVWYGPDVGETTIGRAELLDVAKRVDPRLPQWVVQIVQEKLPKTFWARFKFLFSGKVL